MMLNGSLGRFNGEISSKPQARRSVSGAGDWPVRSPTTAMRRFAHLVPVGGIAAPLALAEFSRDRGASAAVPSQPRQLRVAGLKWYSLAP